MSLSASIVLRARIKLPSSNARMLVATIASARELISKRRARRVGSSRSYSRSVCTYGMVYTSSLVRSDRAKKSTSRVMAHHPRLRQHRGVDTHDQAGAALGFDAQLRIRTAQRTLDAQACRM